MKEKLISLLVVDRDTVFRTTLSSYLRQHSIHVVDVGTYEDAKCASTTFNYQLAIVEWTHSCKEAMLLCSRLRVLSPNVSIVFLSESPDLDSQLEGYTYGADDYWTKPFPMSLALAKAQAMLRKHTALTLRADRIRMGDIEVDFRTRLVHRNGQRVDLSEKEYGILRTLALEDGAPVRRETLLARVWGYDQVPVTRTVDNYIVALRRKLEVDPARPQYLVTVGGIGYRLNTD